jgi:hypothetical protein
MRASDVQREIDRITQNRTTIMNETLTQLAKQAQVEHCISHVRLQEFAELIVRECIDKIETHRIPVGNSAAGEMACEWTYAALKEIRDEITEHFGIDND